MLTFEYEWNDLTTNVTRYGFIGSHVTLYYIGELVPIQPQNHRKSRDFRNVSWHVLDLWVLFCFGTC